MAITLLDSENADLDLASGATVLTDTQSVATLCQCVVYMGDGTKNLDASGGAFTIQVTLGSQEGIVVTRTLGTVARAVIQTDPFTVPANTDVTVEVVSPNGADSDVDVTAYLYDMALEEITSIYDKLPTNYIMGSATVDDQDTIVLSGTCPDNTSTADSIKLAADASGVNDYYNENLVVLVGGTGVGQARLIADYAGGSQTAVVRNAWLTTPDNTTQYRIYPFSGILLSNTGLVVAATSDTITLNASAQAVADVYVGHTIFISGGTGLGQARLITAYTVGRVATVSPAWDVTPGAAASIYLILPVGRTYVDTVGADAIDDIADVVCSDLHVTLDSETDVIVSDLALALNSDLDVVQSDLKIVASGVNTAQSDLTLVQRMIPAKMIRYNLEAKTLYGRTL